MGEEDEDLDEVLKRFTASQTTNNKNYGKSRLDADQLNSTNQLDVSNVRDTPMQSYASNQTLSGECVTVVKKKKGRPKKIKDVMVPNGNQVVDMNANYVVCSGVGDHDIATTQYVTTDSNNNNYITYAKDSSQKNTDTSMNNNNNNKENNNKNNNGNTLIATSVTKKIVRLANTKTNDGTKNRISVSRDIIKNAALNKSTDSAVNTTNERTVSIYNKKISMANNSNRRSDMISWDDDIYKAYSNKGVIKKNKTVNINNGKNNNINKINNRFNNTYNHHNRKRKVVSSGKVEDDEESNGGGDDNDPTPSKKIHVNFNTSTTVITISDIIKNINNDDKNKDYKNNNNRIIKNNENNTLKANRHEVRSTNITNNNKNINKKRKNNKRNTLSTNVFINSTNNNNNNKSHHKNNTLNYDDENAIGDTNNKGINSKNKTIDGDSNISTTNDQNVIGTNSSNHNKIINNSLTATSNHNVITDNNSNTITNNTGYVMHDGVSNKENNYNNDGYLCAKPLKMFFKSKINIGNLNGNIDWGNDKSICNINGITDNNIGFSNSSVHNIKTYNSINNSDKNLNKNEKLNSGSFETSNDCPEESFERGVKVVNQCSSNGGNNVDSISAHSDGIFSTFTMTSDIGNNARLFNIGCDTNNFNAYNGNINKNFNTNNNIVTNNNNGKKKNDIKTSFLSASGVETDITNGNERSCIEDTRGRDIINGTSLLEKVVTPTEVYNEGDANVEDNHEITHARATHRGNDTYNYNINKNYSNNNVNLNI